METRVLQSKVKELEGIHHRTGTPRVWRQLEAARKQLAGLDLDRAEFSLLHLKHLYYLSGNKSVGSWLLNCMPNA